MKKLILIAFAGVIVLTFLALHYFRKGTTVKFVISQGETAVQIAQNLKKQKIISNPFWFKILTKITFTDNKLKKGRYLLRTNMSSEEALYRLLTLSGNIYIRITVLEGWRTEEIAEKLEENNITSAKDFITLAQKRNLEGYLFPSTYLFEENTPTEIVIDTMIKE
ncbi:MAG TPA: endolytic transglycosylase MltG, partial [Elusimicrobiales bacterium]|nr:endolytic transglycosylase MltG [Elusimicrobiales bacterium]